MQFDTEKEFFLVDCLGLSGKSLRDMNSVILTIVDLVRFQNFVLENDGRYKTINKLVNEYRTILIREIECEGVQIKTIGSMLELKEYLEYIFKENVSEVLCQKLYKKIENKLLGVVEMVDSLRENKRYFNINLSIKSLLNNI